MLGEKHLQSFTFCSHLEELSRNTVENALNCREILEEFDFMQHSDVNHRNRDNSFDRDSMDSMDTMDSMDSDIVEDRDRKRGGDSDGYGFRDMDRNRDNGENREIKDSNNANDSDGTEAGNEEKHGASHKCSVYLVTNEFHAPRARLIFENVLLPSLSSHNDNDNNCDHMHFPFSLVCCPASSGLPCGEYRPVHLRPSDSNQWRLCERLDWEVSALESINEYLGKYKLGPISQKRIDQALKELRSLNNTIALSSLSLGNESSSVTDSVSVKD